ncbi:MAG: anthranilate phosphoribosyltransferase [Phycisphaerales bacterium]|nr:anthranilate phosphoribosyltransferase [Phycisphaerales bacterium]
METHATLAQLLAGEPLSAPQAEVLFESLLTGGLDDAQIGALLALIQARGPVPDELVGAATAMRRHVTRVPIEPNDGQVLIDTCGTGGAPKVFNVSTVAAIVAAAAAGAPEQPGILVAKHGNRSRSGRGSAEVLERLGVNVHASPEVQAECLRRAGVCFCFAIHHHPAMRYAAGPRKSLGFRTIFNLLGPLTNPAGARRQLIGVYDLTLVEVMARALAALGAERAIVAHGMDGLDELTTCAESVLVHVVDGSLQREHVRPPDLGIAPATHGQLAVQSLDEAADVAKAVLDGESGPHRDITLLNVAAALLVAGTVSRLGDGIEKARLGIDSGRARRVLEHLREVSHLS